MTDYIRNSIDQNFPPEPPDDPRPEPPPPPDDALPDDLEIERILAMSDDEILAEARADGIDTDKQAREMAAQFDVIARLVRERDRARELLGRSWLRNARQSRENKRAVALLRAVERIDTHGKGNGSYLLDGWWASYWLDIPVESVKHGPLAGALIALAAQLDARDA